jgi:hypothetical protein
LTQQGFTNIFGGCHSGMVRRTRPQGRNCIPGNLEIPGSMLRITPE